MGEYNNYYYKYYKYKLKYELLKNSLQDIKFIITIPHAKCLTKEENVCDQTSLHHATKLKKVLDDRNIKYIFLPAQEHRSYCDYNRERCKDKIYLKKFKYLANANKNAIILDIHSFFNPSSKKKVSFENNDMALLIKKQYSEQYSKATQFVTHMKKYINKIKLYPGRENYIVNSTYDHPYSFLIEFNDSVNFNYNIYEHIINFFI